MVLAAGVAFIMMKVLSKKKQVLIEDAALLYLIGICGAVIGAITLRPIMNLAEVASNWNNYSSLSFLEIIRHVSGEIVFYGGLLGGMVAVILFCRKYKIGIIAFFDLAVPPLAFAHAIGRLGCFAGGCCYGIEMPYNHRLAVIYPPISPGAPSGIPLLAVQPIETAFLLALSILLNVIFLKGKRKGVSASVYLIVYPVGRFILEFFRGDIVRGMYGFLTTSQIISIFLFVCGVFCLIRVVLKKNFVGGL